MTGAVSDSWDEDTQQICGWSFADDPANPTPMIYPTCPDCGEAYSYRRFLSLSRGDYVWAWAKPEKLPRGCRHKSPVKTIVTDKQRYPQQETP